MRGKTIVFAIFLLVLLTIIGCSEEKQEGVIGSETQLIRFHVIANSDSDEDQLLKNMIRDNLLEYIEPALQEVQSIEEAIDYLEINKVNFEQIARNSSIAYGYDYKIEAVLGTSNYPTRNYRRLVLPAGEYLSLKIHIGDAAGSNWWCVLFPPLCFVDITRESVSNSVEEDDYVFHEGFKARFIILDYLEKLFAKREGQ